MEYAKIYDGLLNFAWADFATDTTRFADPTPANAIFRAAPAFTAMALRTKFFGEGYGYYGEMQKAAGDVSSQVRQGLLTTGAGCRGAPEACRSPVRPVPHGPPERRLSRQ